jgi:hypothetical protein
MNFAAGVILWAEAIGNEAMRDMGIFLYTTEHQAVEQYWFDVDREVFPPQYLFETVGILWSHGVAYATWWTANPEEIHGINFLPLTGGALYLGHRPDYVLRNINALYAAPGAEGHWNDLIWQYEALADPAAALARWESAPNYVEDGAQEAGQTKPFTYHWLHTFNAVGQVDPTVTADIPTYAVLRDPTTGDRTCVAYNGTGMPRTVTFSNDAVLNVPPHTLVSTPAGECEATVQPGPLAVGFVVPLDYSVVEGEAVTVAVSLNDISDEVVTVDYATVDGTAVAGTDYIALSGTLTFAPGTHAQTITVSTIANNEAGGDRSFQLLLSNPTVAVISPANSTANILISDGAVEPLPTVGFEVTGYGVDAGGTGVMTVTLGMSHDQVVTVDYATMDDTAIGNTHYTPTSGTLTFAPGTTSQTISIATLVTDPPSGDTSLKVELTNPTGAILAENRIATLLVRSEIPPLWWSYLPLISR